MAILRTLQEIPINSPLRVNLTNTQVMKNITEKLTKWDAYGFVKTKDAKLD